jgi:hypothetical protein
MRFALTSFLSEETKEKPREKRRNAMFARTSSTKPFALRVSERDVRVRTRRSSNRRAVVFKARAAAAAEKNDDDDDDLVVLTESECDDAMVRNRSRRQMLLMASTTTMTTTFAASVAFDAARAATGGASSSEWASLNDGSAPGLASPPPSNTDPIIKKTERLGLKYELLASGSGDERVEINDVVEVDYVMRRANGYFIYSNADCGIGCGNGDPERWAIADGFVDTIPEMLVGMKKGEVRKFLVKPEFGYASAPKTLKPQPPEYGQRRQIEAHCTEPLLFEVRVVKIRKSR